MSSGGRDDRKTFIDFDDDPLEAPGAEVEPPAQASRFRIDEELARGGLGRVHRGYDRALDREVAVKGLLRVTTGARARFERETLLTARLQHPNIVPVYDGGTDDDGEPYLAMRLVHGRSLTEAIDDGETLEERLALVPHVIDACNAIAYAHNERITHRDLKPDNILVGAYGETVVIDWGLAKDLDADEDLTVDATGPTTSGLHSNSSLTRVGAVVGTPAYMPPEQAAGEAVGVQADVYALGAVLYHTLAGHRPYHDAPEALKAVAEGPPLSLAEALTGVPRDLLAVVEKAMSRDLASRYADATELAHDLEQFQNGRFVDAYDYSWSERVVRFVRQNPALFAVSTLLVVGSVLGVVGLARAERAAEAGRLEAVAARDAFQELQAEERRRLDALTLEQARLLMLDEPARSLALLDSLSPDFELDGRVRTVASAAFTAHPPTRVRLPFEGTPLAGDAGNGEYVLVHDGELWRIPMSGEGGRVVPLPSPAVDVIAMEGGYLVCAGTAWFGRWTDEAPTRIPDVPQCRSLHRIRDHARISLEQGFWFIDSDGRVTERVETGGHMLANYDGQSLWLVGKQSLEFHRDGQILTRPAPFDEVYGLVAGPGGRELALLYENPALRIATFEGDRIGLRSIETEYDWLVVGAWLDARRLVIGGSGSRLTVIDVTDGAVLQTLDVEGSPTTAGYIDGRLVVVTDNGHIYSYENLEGRLHGGSIAGSGESVLWTRAVDGQLLNASFSGVYRQSLDRAAGAVVARHAGRIHALHAREDGSLLIAGDEGVQRLNAEGEVTRIAEGLHRVIVTCGGHTWVGGRGAMSDLERGIQVPVDGVVVDARCHGSSVVIGTRTGQLTVAAVEDGATTLQIDSGSGLMERLHIRGDEVVVVGDDVVVLDLQSGMSRPGTDLAVGVSGGVGERVVYATREALSTDEGPFHDLRSRPYSMTSGERGLALGDVQGDIYYWRTLDEPPARLLGHRQYVHRVMLDPKQERLASGAWDNTAWLWDLSTPIPSGRPLIGHDAAVLTLAWSPDGQGLYTGDHRGVVRRWSDGLSKDPDVLRRQIHAMVEALETGRPLPTLEALSP